MTTSYKTLALRLNYTLIYRNYGSGGFIRNGRIRNGLPIDIVPRSPDRLAPHIWKSAYEALLTTHVAYSIPKR